jgi:hypothetical protein
MTWIGSKIALCNVPSIINNKDKHQTGDKRKPTNKASHQTRQATKQKQANRQKQTKANKGVHTFFGSLLARRKSGAIIITNHAVW